MARILILILFFIPYQALAFTTLETDQGLVLVQDTQPSTDTLLMAETNRNPFRWTSKVAQKFSQEVEQERISEFASLHLNGIVWDDKEPMAIIDNVLVQEGHQINGVPVSTLFCSAVLLEAGSQHHFLKFTPLYSFDNNDNSL